MIGWQGKTYGKPPNNNAVDGNAPGAKGGNAKCGRCGEVGYMTVQDP